MVRSETAGQADVDVGVPALDAHDGAGHGLELLPLLPGAAPLPQPDRAPH
jgi:hypothetical protein